MEEMMPLYRFEVCVLWKRKPKEAEAERICSLLEEYLPFVDKGLNSWCLRRLTDDKAWKMNNWAEDDVLCTGRKFAKRMAKSVMDELGYWVHLRIGYERVHDHPENVYTMTKAEYDRLKGGRKCSGG